MATKIRNADLQQNGHGNGCFVCNRTCNNTCSRCSEFYCSKQCQVADWREHKYYCFEMPELIMKSLPHNDQQVRNRKVVENLQNGLKRNEHRNERKQSNSYEKPAQSAESPQSAPPKSTFDFADPPKNNDDVVLTFARFANSFYIRTCSSDSEYMKNAKDFDLHGRKGMKLLSLPQKNDIILARNDGRFQRAVVLQVDTEANIQVALVDTGRKVFKTIHEMRQLSDDLKSRKRFNFIVTLEHLPKNIERDSFTKLIQFLNNGTVFTLKFDGDDWESATNFKLLGKESGIPIEVLAATSNGPEMKVATKQIDKRIKSVEVEKNANDSNRNISPEILLVRSETNNAHEMEVVSSTKKVEEPINSLENKDNSNQLISPKKLKISDLTTETLPDVADLIITDDSSIGMGYVSAISKKNEAKFNELQRKVEKYGSVSNEVYKPEADEVCLINCANEWYRAIKCQSSPKYLLFDWGPLEVIDENDIRQLPNELNDPCYTFICNIKGFTADLQTKIGELLTVDLETVHSNCICVKADDQSVYNVTFPLVQDLVQK